MLMDYRGFLLGPFGRANGFLSPPSAGLPATFVDVLPSAKPNSEMRYFSSSSEGSEVSTLREAKVEELLVEDKNSFTSFTTNRTALEYSMRCLTGDAEGHE